MNKLEANFSIVSPMFIGGAGERAELRVPSIKGLLRFWWRAFAYPLLNGDLKKMAQNEAQLFGSTENGAPFLLRLSNEHKGLGKVAKNQVCSRMVKPDRPGARYLGYGLMDAFNGRNASAGKLLRECITPNQKFSICAISRNPFSADLIKAFKLLGLLGALGSRSRKGYGSITLNRIKINNKPQWKKPQTIEGYKEELKTLIGQAAAFENEPEISAFSRHTRIKYIDTSRSPFDLINQWGLQMQRYRSWGHKGQVNNRPSEKNFKQDHDWYRNIGPYRKTDFHPRRVVFGLPHNYDSKEDGGRVSGTLHDRRSSPLMFHIHKISCDTYIGLAILLRSRFLPEEEKINAGGKAVRQKIEWNVLERFLDNKTYFEHSADWI